MITAIRDHIIFKFVDKLNRNNQFVRDNTESGIILGASFDESAKGARWGTIVSVGPEVDDVLRQPNIEILVEALKWTDSAEVPELGKVWRTDQNQVLGYREVA